MAVLVVEILKMFKVLPDMYIIKAFIMTCCPGLVARDMAWAFFLAKMRLLAACVVLEAAAEDVGEDRLRSAAATWEYPTVGVNFVNV